MESTHCNFCEIVRYWSIGTSGQTTKIVKFFRSPFRGLRPPSPTRALKRELKRAFRVPSPTRELKRAVRPLSPPKTVRKLFRPCPETLGRKGERKVERKLGRLNSSKYDRFYDLVLPSRFGLTQIDHVVVSRYGVFVIETKNYSGWIFGNETSKVWTQVLYGEKHTLENPLRQNYRHTNAIESYLSLHSNTVFSIVVFVGNGKFRTSMPSNVMYANRLVRYIRSRSDPILSQEQAEWIVDRLQRHQSGLKARSSEAVGLRLADPDPRCPTCGAEMIKRTARRGKNTGKDFLGCSQFPGCRGTRPI